MGRTENDDQGSSSEVKQFANENNPCLADCGFFGATCFKGYCSKCFTQLEIAKLTSETAGAQLEDSAIMNDRSNATTNAISDNANTVANKALTFTPEDATTCTDENIECSLQQSENIDKESIEIKRKVSNIDQEIEKSNNLNLQPITDTSNPIQKKREQINKNTCATCSKKLKLTDIECRCGLRLCSEHRYSDRHECTFDYKKQQQEKLKTFIKKVAPKNLDNF